MTTVVDPDRLKRIHVVNVRGKDGKFFVVLQDKDDDKHQWEVSWETWLRDRNEIITGG